MFYVLFPLDKLGLLIGRSPVLCMCVCDGESVDIKAFQHQGLLASEYNSS
jgi:hypothetical protein